MPSIVEELLTLLPLIREFPVSHLGPETGYPVRLFLAFLSLFK
jgi:hypothetical protein